MMDEVPLWEQEERKRGRKRLVLALMLALAALLLFYTNRAVTYYFNPARANPPDQIVLLTTSWCPFCNALKRCLDAAHMPYREIDVEQDWTTSYAYEATLSRGVPVTVIGSDTIRGGFSEQLLAIESTCARINVDGRFRCDAFADGLRSRRQAAAVELSRPRVGNR
jgi:glutaredoxin